MKLIHPKLSIDKQILSFEQITEAISKHPEQLAHYLATTNPTLATELLEELLIWRKCERI